MRARLAAAALAAAALGAAIWWRRNPSACPYAQRFWVEAPHPVISRRRLRSMLAPLRGERVLEIGPGTGYYTLDLAAWVGGGGADGGGIVEILDLQRQFLDHTMRRAAGRGVANVLATQGDATALPYEDGSIDAVVLITVLGEIPNRAAALGEIRRVLRPGGRLIVGEIAVDPHFTTLRTLRLLAAGAGLRFDGSSGVPLAYFARLRAD